MQVLAQAGDLRAAEFQAGQRGPVADEQDSQDLFEVGIQFIFLKIRLQAEFAEQFDFKGEEGLRLGWLPGDVMQEAGEQ